ncbi:MAG: mannose-6-phosphate isomerase, class I [Treponema sp.]|jgi:mannose-6-phosphate isomerase|nr:mannose-6-phosphate isomerase, class I [Treponema sp.]
MPKSNLHFEILGASFTITADEEGPYLEKLLSEYYARVLDVQKTTGLKDPLKIAILTGFLLCDEFHKLKQESGDISEKEETLRRTLNLIARLDETFEKDGQVLQALYLLENSVKHYEWGSPHWIPRLLCRENPGGEPWAELWMGVHPSAPSMLKDWPGKKSLAQLIAADPPRYVGKEGAANFGGLPFLFKLLAAARPLSIQAHPGKEQARQGWQRENEQGIDLDAPERNYKDDNHKPEIICALSPFTALCGFRSPGDTVALLSAFLAGAPRSLQYGLAPLQDSLENTAGRSRLPLRDFLAGLFNLSRELRKELSAYASTLSRIPWGIDDDTCSLIRRLAELYPGDPGILAPLYLNLIHLESGQAIYLPDGILHAYVDGFGVELMANSDNVLRCGLSSKHVDVNELMNVLYFHPFMPELLKTPPETEPPGPVFFTYPSPCKEFSLSLIRNFEGPFPIQVPVIVIVIAGRLQASDETGASWELGPGESAFIPPQPDMPVFSGTYTLYAASIPAPVGH